MGRKDSKSRDFFSDPRRFADLFNGICFGGEEVLKADDLTDWDPHPGSRTRDVVKLASFGVGFAIIGEESQETVDYALPVRIFESDLKDYKRQVAAIQKETRQKIKDKDPEMKALTPGERLYRYPKDAKIIPVVTIVLSNAEKWDGPRDLTDMLDTENVPTALLQFISNYRINIVEFPKLTAEMTSRFRTDVRQVIDVLRCLRDPTALRELVQDNEDYRNLEKDTYEYICEYTTLKKYNLDDEGGKYDMRDAFDMIIEEERADERKKTEKRDAEQHRKDLHEMIVNFLKTGDTPEKISQCMNVPIDDVRKINAGLLRKA